MPNRFFVQHPHISGLHAVIDCELSALVAIRMSRRRAVSRTR
jgi:hypothetical protein